MIHSAGLVVFSFENFPSQTLSSVSSPPPPPPPSSFAFLSSHSHSFSPTLPHSHTALLTYPPFFSLLFLSPLHALLPLLLFLLGRGGSDRVDSGSSGNRKMELPFPVTLSSSHFKSVARYRLFGHINLLGMKRGRRGEGEGGHVHALAEQGVIREPSLSTEVT